MAVLPNAAGTQEVGDTCLRAFELAITSTIEKTAVTLIMRGSEDVSKLARKSASPAALPATYCPPTAAEASMAATSGEPSCQRDESIASGCASILHRGP
jgi:hypothetical protein